VQDVYDAETVRAYGQAEANFGGTCFDGDVLVALFTDDLDRHLNRLRPSLRAPDQYRAESTDDPATMLAPPAVAVLVVAIGFDAVSVAVICRGRGHRHRGGDVCDRRAARDHR